MSVQVVHIRSENADFQRLESIGRNRKKRREHGVFLVEGVRPVNLALQHGWAFEALILPDRRDLSAWAHGVMAQAGARTHYLLPAEGFDLLTERNEGSELLALLRLPPDDRTLPTPENMRVVLLDRPGNPGNLGSIVRSCDAFGFHGVGVVGHGVDPFSREAVRASTGSMLALPVVHFPGPADVQAWLSHARARLGKVTLVGTDEHGELEARAYPFGGPTVLVAGNETAGMSAALRELCDATVRIPIQGSASSLNVAVATSILLYEMASRPDLEG